MLSLPSLKSCKGETYTVSALKEKHDRHVSRATASASMLHVCQHRRHSGAVQSVAYLCFGSRRTVGDVR